MKVCISCRESKSFSMFASSNKAADGLQGYCKPCADKAAKESYERNKEKKVAAALNWAESNPEKRAIIHFRARLKRYYGKTYEWYVETLKQQGGKCAICGSSSPGGKRRFFSVDHCHKTGRIRSLLCNSCNAGIGYLKEDSSIMKNAIAYVERNAP